MVASPIGSWSSSSTIPRRRASGRNRNTRFSVLSCAPTTIALTFLNQFQETRISDQALEQAERRLRAGDFAAYGEAQQRLANAIQRAIDAQAQIAASSSNRPSPSPSPTGSG